ncbi:MAG: 50S ribosomal protein L21 [Actinomycetes bacterium]|nr:50S ribosomal protein L21 [Actinomycetota bacterium]
MVYAIVKAGGRQEKVAVGDTLLVDRVAAATGATIKLQALLLVDGAKVTTDTAGINVSVEVLEEIKGPKIDILRYKSKTGYRRRQGFRAKLTRVKVTSINGVK